jgi:hypothetical protein
VSKQDEVMYVPALKTLESMLQCRNIMAEVKWQDSLTEHYTLLSEALVEEQDGRD